MYLVTQKGLNLKFKALRALNLGEGAFNSPRGLI